MMKSPLIKAVVQMKIFSQIDPPIYDPIPFNEDGSLNILDSLKTIVQNVDRDMIGYHLYSLSRVTLFNEINRCLFVFFVFFFFFFFFFKLELRHRIQNVGTSRFPSTALTTSSCIEFLRASLAWGLSTQTTSTWLPMENSVSTWCCTTTWPR